jgi:hypothetical protein
MWSLINNIPRDNLDAWFRWLTVFTIGLPIIGAIMGGICGWGAFLVSERIGSLQTTDVTQAREGAAKANERAAEAQAALQKFKASRSLLPEQQSTVVDAIKAFAGQEFAGAVAASVPDAWSLWETLDQTLRAAHWVRRPPWGLATGHPPAGIPVSPNEGVTIFVPQDDLVSLAPAVDALSSALNAAGLKTYVARDAGPQTRPKIIVVEIGTKPQ